MEENGFQITLSDYWRNTIRTSEAALAMLQVFEGKQLEIVDNAVASLRTLVNDGRDYPSLVEQKIPKGQQQQQQQIYATSKYDQDPGWKRVDSNTLEVPLGKGTVATCIAVNRADQLDQLIKEIYEVPYIAIDCEFLGVKNNLPELKLLQIGVSSSRGYAIQVDILGVEIITDKLKPVLEDENLNIVGWSYRSDAMAIESYIKDITQAPVLDLQSKLLRVAVETLNLAAAMNKFAQAWKGLEVFQSAKQFGNSFDYLNNKCIWIENPLPPRALVYAVFDVLSVHALYQLTEDLPQDESNYWPYTVLHTTSTKALERFHRQRAKGISSSPTPIDSPQVSNKGKGPLYGSPGSRRNFKYTNKDKYDTIPVPLSPQPETDDGYDDNDARYTLDLQKAIELSVQDSKKPRCQSGESSSSSDRIVGDLVEDSTDPHFNNYITYAENVVKIPKEPELATSAWGQVNLEQQPFIGGNFRFNAEAAGFTPGKKIENTINTITVAPSPTPVVSNTPTNTASTTEIQSTWTSLADEGETEEVKSTKKQSAWKTADEYDQVKKTWQSFQQEQEEKSPRQQSYRTPKQSYRHSPQQPNFRSPTTNQQQQRFSKPSSQPFNTNNNSYRNGSNSRPFSANNEYNRSKPSAPSPATSTASLPTPGTTFTPVPAPVSVTATTSPAMGKTSASTCQFKSKPSKEKYTADFKTRLTTGNQTGSFTWDTGLDGHSMTAASWKDFASLTENNWKLGNDTEIDAMEAAAATAAAANQEQRKSYKFNTVVASHGSGHVDGSVGDNATGAMHDETRDSWAIKEEMPDTMVMPMNQIPIRTKFSGPRIMNPDDDYTDDDDDDHDDEEEKEEKQVVTKEEGSLEDLPIFVDAIFLYSDEGDGELPMLKLTAPHHLDMIQTPPVGTPFTVTIGFHVAEGKNGDMNLKALQLYLSTGASYTCILEQACLLKYKESLKSTKFGQLLTDPSIKRICWYPKYIETTILEKLGFTLGICVDLAQKVNYYAETLNNEADPYNFKDAVNHFLKGWPDLEQYNEIKDDFEKGSARSFSGSRWDRERLPEAVLKYSAMQGLTAYTLYQVSETWGLNDDEFLYENTQ